MENQYYTKATKLEEIDNAVRFNVPIGADHPFFTDFSEVRGDFEDTLIYKMLNVDTTTYIYNSQVNRANKTLLFLAGMRGSGKTSELAKIAQKLHNKKAFFCVTCNIDDGLDVNDMEYMDILIFQLERLFEELKEHRMIFETPIVASLQKWFAERVEETNQLIKADGGLEVEVQASTPKIPFLSFLSLASKVKGSLSGSKENAKKLRTVFKSNFREFALKTNEFIAFVNNELSRNDKAKEILFIIDGLEKTASLDIRKKIIVEESERIKQIKVNTIFTLPVELTPEGRKLESFSTLVPFPFVKIINRDGSKIEKAIQKFIEFTYKRIDKSLFDSEETVRKAIMIGGGSPREYLRVLEYANYYTEKEKGIIDKIALEKGIKKLAAYTSHYISEEDLELLKVLKSNNDKQLRTPYGEKWHDLIEKLIILEYNDGTYKRVNPIVEESELYKQYVLDAE